MQEAEEFETHAKQKKDPPVQELVDFLNELFQTFFSSFSTIGGGFSCQRMTF